MCVKWPLLSHMTVLKRNLTHQVQLHSHSCPANMHTQKKHTHSHASQCTYTLKYMIQKGWRLHEVMHIQSYSKNVDTPEILHNWWGSEFNFNLISFCLWFHIINHIYLFDRQTKQGLNNNQCSECVVTTWAL